MPEISRSVDVQHRLVSQCNLENFAMQMIAVRQGQLIPELKQMFGEPNDFAFVRW